jgi:hypothetical protein
LIRVDDNTHTYFQSADICPDLGYYPYGLMTSNNIIFTLLPAGRDHEHFES